MIFIIHSSDQYTKYLKANRNDREIGGNLLSTFKGEPLRNCGNGAINTLYCQRK